MKTIMLYSFQAVKHKLKAKIGYFDLYGFDFLIDNTMKVGTRVSDVYSLLTISETVYVLLSFYL